MLSNENKQLLIDYIKQNLTVDNLASRDNISNPTYIFRYKNYHPLFIEYMKEWVIENYTYDAEDYDDAITSEKPYDTKFFKMVDDRQKRLEGHLYCINKLLDNIPIDKFKFTYNQTNYRPCHNILVEVNFKNPRQSWVNSTNIQIRKEDFPFNEGSCYGRNTSAVKTFKLSNTNFDKYCKIIGVK